MREALSALITRKRLLSGVDPYVIGQIVFVDVALAALLANVRSQASVNS